MTKLVNIGFGNVVSSDKVLSVVNPDASPIKRLIAHAKEQERIIDATQGRKTKSVIFTSEHILILSALQTETITKRFNQNIWTEEREEHDEQ